jgi:hypothetical protein
VPEGTAVIVPWLPGQGLWAAPITITITVCIIPATTICSFSAISSSSSSSNTGFYEPIGIAGSDSVGS